MDTNKKSPRELGEELLDGFVKMVAVWGSAFVIVERVDHILSGVVSRGWRGGISLLAGYLFVLAVLPGGEKWPRLRDTLFAWRYPIVMLLAIYLGYQWHAYDYPRSQEGRLDEAARRACAKIASCQKAAVDYLTDRGLDD